MNFTTNHKIVLASASPRRKELFSKLGVPFDIITSNVEETSVDANTVQEYVREVALLKTRDVATKNKGKTVIGADTIVVFENQLLHKPKNYEEAISHLQKLSNNVHSVLTAVAIIDHDGSEYTIVEETKVYFKKLSLQLIKAYVDTNDPFDKAGGYGIQTDGALFINRIEGDYNNVVGFPLATVFEKLVSLSILHIKGSDLEMVVSTFPQLLIRDVHVDDRPRERLMKQGPQSLSNQELIAILLRTGTKKESVLSLANRVLNSFEKLQELKHATLEEIVSIKGIGEAKAVQLLAAIELGRRLA